MRVIKKSNLIKDQNERYKKSKLISNTKSVFNFFKFLSTIIFVKPRQKGLKI